jgi:hypothetical protein
VISLFFHLFFTEWCFAEDELVSLDELQEKIAEFEDYVQSSDIAAMQSVYYLTIILGSH